VETANTPWYDENHPALHKKKHAGGGGPYTLGGTKETGGKESQKMKHLFRAREKTSEERRGITENLSKSKKNAKKRFKAKKETPHPFLLIENEKQSAGKRSAPGRTINGPRCPDKKATQQLNKSRKLH